MILLSGGSKARHRGAGLIRNLLFSTKTCEAVAQVYFIKACEHFIRAQQQERDMDGSTYAPACTIFDKKKNTPVHLYLNSIFVRMFFPVSSGAWNGKSAPETAAGQRYRNSAESYHCAWHSCTIPASERCLIIVVSVTLIDICMHVCLCCDMCCRELSEGERRRDQYAYIQTAYTHV